MRSSMEAGDVGGGVSATTAIFPSSSSTSQVLAKAAEVGDYPASRGGHWKVVHFFKFLRLSPPNLGMT
jgi:hypothetical protein